MRVSWGKEVKCTSIAARQDGAEASAASRSGVLPCSVACSHCKLVGAEALYVRRGADGEALNMFAPAALAQSQPEKLGGPMQAAGAALEVGGVEEVNPAAARAIETDPCHVRHPEPIVTLAREHQ